jgi:hypothetical protein
MMAESAHMPELNDSRMSSTKNKNKHMLTALSDEEVDDKRNTSNLLDGKQNIQKKKIERSKTPVPETL